MEGAEYAMESVRIHVDHFNVSAAMGGSEELEYRSCQTAFISVVTWAEQKLV